MHIQAHSNPVINRTWINNFDQADLQGRITDSTSALTGTPGSAQEPALTVPEPKGTGVAINVYPHVYHRKVI
ncbi:hypothetical protein H4Q26_007120 [Puccinia striiformis f. sp. tritici PST-130]|nr:hypothetical protein H4Q26_007120 [Puccinia striiformis f. sp. tritici PST-130]